MSRDPSLEEDLRHLLGQRKNLSEKAMFGGLAFLLGGHMLCAASSKGVMLRLGPGRDAWALQLAGIGPMVMRGKALSGWIFLDSASWIQADLPLRQRLLQAALDFQKTL